MLLRGQTPRRCSFLKKSQTGVAYHDVFRRRRPGLSGNDLADRDIAPPGQEGWTRH